MPRYVLVNRRAGKFTDDAKRSSRGAVASALTMLRSTDVIFDHQPKDETARRVVVLDADETEIRSIRENLPQDAILEPAVQRQLHRHTPIKLRPTLPMPATTAGAVHPLYSVTVKGGGAPLANIEVMFYFDHLGQTHVDTKKTDSQGRVSVAVPSGFTLSLVEPIPYADFWIMLVKPPASGGTIDCAPVAKADAHGTGWWHGAMKIKATDPNRGAGIKVGVIDTGCGPHPNLAHVTLVGAFIDGEQLPPNQGYDVAEHGTHTSGIIGARPSKAGDYAGLAPGCELFHARVFKDESPQGGPSQAEIIMAIDALSRDHQCDLINMSLGGGPPTQSEEDAIRDAEERGTLCICSAGNDAGAIEYPGAYQECAAVSAIGQRDWAPANTFSAGNLPNDPEMIGKNNLFLAAFSCYGPTLACAGPGVGIVSTVPARPPAAPAPYMEMDGTSMASPAACGALAVILSQDAQYKSLPRDKPRAKRARTLLANHCQTIGLDDQYQGKGVPAV